MNQLTYAVDNLSNVKVNSEAARSRILDTDYAVETSELARTQIIQQAGTAMLSSKSCHRQYCRCSSRPMIWAIRVETPPGAFL